MSLERAKRAEDRAASEAVGRLQKSTRQAEHQKNIAAIQSYCFADSAEAVEGGEVQMKCFAEVPQVGDSRAVFFGTWAGTGRRTAAGTARWLVWADGRAVWLVQTGMQVGPALGRL